MQIEELPIASIKPYEKNPRKNDGAVNGVAESIRQFGFQQPIVIDTNNVIVAGHTRYKAGLKLGLKTVPCVRADKLTKEQVKAYRILDNKLNELAGWDFVTLSEELSSFNFNFDDFNIQLPTFEQQESFVLRSYETNRNEINNSGNFMIQQPDRSFSPSEKDENFNESTLPQELRGRSLKPDVMPIIKGDDRTTCDRIIIVFKENQKEDICNLLGLKQINKVVYTFNEIVDKNNE